MGSGYESRGIRMLMGARRLLTPLTTRVKAGFVMGKLNSDPLNRNVSPSSPATLSVAPKYHKILNPVKEWTTANRVSSANESGRALPSRRGSFAHEAQGEFEIPPRFFMVGLESQGFGKMLARLLEFAGIGED